MSDINNPESQLFQSTIASNPRLTRKEENDLADRAQAGDEAAIEKLVLSNVRLVFKIAKRFQCYSLDYDDLCSEGNMGLMKAATKFRSNAKCSFATYASFWIKQRVIRALSNHSRTIRIPVHSIQRIANMKKAMAKLENELFREPTNEEISAASKIKLEEVIRLKMCMIAPTSLQALIGEEIEFGDIIQDPNVESPEEMFNKKSMNSDVAECVEKLEERERDIIKFRFGMENSDRQTLEQLGKKWGITRERIRQIQNMALEQIARMLKGQEKVS